MSAFHTPECSTSISHYDYDFEDVGEDDGGNNDYDDGDRYHQQQQLLQEQSDFAIYSRKDLRCMHGFGPS